MEFDPAIGRATGSSISRIIDTASVSAVCSVAKPAVSYAVSFAVAAGTSVGGWRVKQGWSRVVAGDVPSVVVELHVAEPA